MAAPARPRPARPRQPARPAPRRTLPRRCPPRAATRRRLVAFLVVMALAFGALTTRLVFLQAVGPEPYTAFGERQLIQTIELPAARGAIFDRNGRELALSVRQTTIWANPRQVTDPAGQAAKLAPILGVDAVVLQDKLSRDSAFQYLARMVNDEVAEQVRALALPGIHFTEEPKRFTPGGDLAAPVLGKVGIDNEGLGGIELQYEDVLAGKPGMKVVEEDPTGTPLPDGVRRLDPAVRGDDLVLTLDRSLQFETERALAGAIVRHNAKGGIALVMDTVTGELLAVANLVAGEDGQPPRAAASNTAVTHVYEPGSVNKLITIAGALEEGIVRPDQRLTVPYTIRVADHTFKEHDYHATEQWSVTDIMANSSNVGSIMIGQQLGKERLDRYLRAFGFGSKSGTGFPGESRGLMLDPKKWSGTSLPTISIGHGVSVTALQMLAAYNTVANGGEYVAPKLVKATVDAHGVQKPTAPSPRRRVISERTAREITAMLNEVVRVGTGTHAAVDGYTVAGKTGTARKPLEGARGYELGAYMSTFAGFVPSERPALTALVMLDDPTPIFGGLVAAPVFAEVVRYGLRQFRIPPPPPSDVPSVPAVSRDTALRGSGEPDPASAPPPASTPTSVAPAPTAPSP